SFSYPGLCHSVMPNERQAVEQLVSHLYDLGHRRFAWIGGGTGFDYKPRRRGGVVGGLVARGLEMGRQNIVVGCGCARLARLAGWKATEISRRQLGGGASPTACVCVNGSVARGFITCLMVNGCRVPAQTSVVAVDATRLCEEEHPQITGAHSDPEKLGMTAA